MVIKTLAKSGEATNYNWIPLVDFKRSVEAVLIIARQPLYNIPKFQSEEATRSIGLCKKHGHHRSHKCNQRRDDECGFYNLALDS